MKISYFPILMIPLLLGACSLLRGGSSKAELVAWASQIASLEKQMEMEINNWNRLSGNIESRAPTQDEYKELVHLNDRVSELYSSMIALQPPPEAPSFGRFVPKGEAGEPMEPPPEEINAEYPQTLDLRRRLQ